MEINELIAKESAHTTVSETCPFCPPEKPSFTTVRGEDNDSGKLEHNMTEFTIERGARPKPSPEGTSLTDDRKKELAKPHPIFTHEIYGPLSCEPHHLVSGKQALAHNSEHDFERWICAPKTIEADTGYSVNNYDNGIWMPSVPEFTIGMKGAWGDLDRLAIAGEAMNVTLKQFHKGGHNIPETKLVHAKLVKAPANERLHLQYDKFLISMLSAMNGRMRAWSVRCGLCTDRPSGKPQPSFRVNDALDRLSAAAGRRITGSPRSWSLFISTLAYLHHCNSGCDHTSPEQLR